MTQEVIALRLTTRKSNLLTFFVLFIDDRFHSKIMQLSIIYALHITQTFEDAQTFLHDLSGILLRKKKCQFFVCVPLLNHFLFNH